MRPSNWYDALHRCQTLGQSYAIVTVMTVAGSTPREAGTKMIVTGDSQYDTIGGGHLEFVVIQKARELLAALNQGELSDKQCFEHFPLAASLGQCCGGSANVLFEVLSSEQLKLHVFGAGHVAHHLMQILASLPIQVCWIDAREELFPEQSPASNIEMIKADDNEAVVDVVLSAQQDSAFLVLTHNHQLDYAIAEAVIKRGDSRFLGVIGSDTKATRFRKRLSAKGFSAEQITTMQSPVGLSEVEGKLPMEVAVSMAGQIITLYQADKKASGQTKKREGIAWKTIEKSLAFDSDKERNNKRVTHTTASST